ncbi:hypothetical protein SpCBS45565_g05379 [Spizellomyces sp. 'palustris']|nr:hypothetical protein SpCBS45565_g05379 [Spizellomyces sp. 'palustris']
MATSPVDRPRFPSRQFPTGNAAELAMWPCRSFTVQETLLPRAVRAATVPWLGVPYTFGDQLQRKVPVPLLARGISHSTVHSFRLLRQQRATYTTSPSPDASRIPPITPISQVDQESQKDSNHAPDGVSTETTRDGHVGVSTGPIDSSEASRATNPPVTGEPLQSGVVLPTRAQPVKYETDWDDGVLDLITKSAGGANANADIADEINLATGCGKTDTQASDVGQGDTSVVPAVTADLEPSYDGPHSGIATTAQEVDADEINPATGCGKTDTQASDVGQGDTSVVPAVTADLEPSYDGTHSGIATTAQEVDLASGDLPASSETPLHGKSSDSVDVNVLEIPEERWTAEVSADTFSDVTAPQDPLSVAISAQDFGTETANDIPITDTPSKPDSDSNTHRLSRVEISMATLIAEQEQITLTLNGLATTMTGLATDIEDADTRSKKTKDQLHAFRHSASQRMDSNDFGWNKKMKQLEDRIVQMERKEQYLWNKLLQLKEETDANLKQLRAQVDKMPDLLEQETSTRRSVGFNPAKAVRDAIISIRNRTITTVQHVFGVAGSIIAKVCNTWSSIRQKISRGLIYLGNKVSPLAPETSSLIEVGERKLDADLLVPMIVRRLTAAGIRPYTNEPYFIYLMDSISEAETFMSIVMDESGTAPFHRIRVVGFDTETAFRNDEHKNFGPTSMVQIAFAEGLVGIFQVYRMCTVETSGTVTIDKNRFPKLLKDFISSTISIKTGVGIWGDLAKLQKHYDVKIPIEAVVPLDSLGRTIGVQRWSLAALSSQYCDMGLQKGTSPPKRWDAPRNLISRNAVLYAANDALAGLRIYKSMVRLPKAQTSVSDDTPVELVQSPVNKSPETTAASFDEIADNIFPKMRKALFGQRQVVPRILIQRWMMAALPAWKELSDFEKRENAHRCVDIFIKDRRLLQGRRGLVLASHHPTSKLTAKNLPSSQYVLVDTSSNDVGDDKLKFEEMSTSNTSSPSNAGRDTSDSAIQTASTKPAGQRSGAVDTPVQEASASAKPAEKSKSAAVDKSPPAKITKKERSGTVDAPVQTASASAKPAEKSKSAAVEKTPPATLAKDERSGAVDSSVQMSVASAKSTEGQDLLDNAAVMVQSRQDIADQIAAALDHAGDEPFFTFYRLFFDTPILITTINALIRKSMKWPSVPKTVDRSLISDALIERLRQQGRLVDGTAPNRGQLILKTEDIPKEVLTQVETVADPFGVLWKEFGTRGTNIVRMQKHLMKPKQSLWPDCTNHNQRQLVAMVCVWQLYVNRRILHVQNYVFRLDPNDAVISSLATSKHSKTGSSKPENAKKGSSESNAAKEEISTADGTKEPANLPKPDESKNTGATPNANESNVPTHPSSVAVIAASESSEPSITSAKESLQYTLDAHANEVGTTAASGNAEDGIAKSGMTASTLNANDSGLPINEPSEAEVKHEILPIDTVLMATVETKDHGGEGLDPPVKTEGEAPTGTVPKINLEKHEQIDLPIFEDTLNTLEPIAAVQAVEADNMTELASDDKIAPEESGSAPKIPAPTDEVREVSVETPIVVEAQHGLVQTNDVLQTEGQAALGEIKKSNLPVKFDTSNAQHMVLELRQPESTQEQGDLSSSMGAISIPPQTTPSVQTSENTAARGVFGDIERSPKPDVEQKNITAPKAASTVDRQLERWMAALHTRKNR